MLECVINISEGRDLETLVRLRASCVNALLDLHSDVHHNRSVFTLGGPQAEVAARSLALCAVQMLDIKTHQGVHPRLGVVDVVPFTPMPDSGTTMKEAQHAQVEFARWIAE